MRVYSHFRCFCRFQVSRMSFWKRETFQKRKQKKRNVNGTWIVVILDYWNAQNIILFVCKHFNWVMCEKVNLSPWLEAKRWFDRIKGWKWWLRYVIDNTSWGEQFHNNRLRIEHEAIFMVKSSPNYKKMCLLLCWSRVIKLCGKPVNSKIRHTSHDIADEELCLRWVIDHSM